ncbi:putative rta1 domain protein [Rosellinia necatrix]|uniref:Putative rta1 domain protein n=1 Tax=Rosellinia necatrix TaxID=77044 RepID=A0A1W2TMF1_ROSNE|nr:putative rta1 domain protein [Rosellinia necatrix]
MTSPITCASVNCSEVPLYRTPTLTGNVVLLVLFAILIPVALVLGTRYRSPGFASAIATGLGLEVAGYIGRLLLHNNPNRTVDFVIFVVGTTLGPTCICGAMFLVVPRIVAVYGEEYRSWRPVWYPIVLCILTLMSLVLELAGSLVLIVHDIPTTVDTGARVLVIGLVVQLIALAIFVFHTVLFAIALRTRQHGLDPGFAPIYTSRLFKIFLASFSLTTILVVLRTAYRTVQIAEGFRSYIARAETPFFILDGAAMLIAAILLLACFPAKALGRAWSEPSVYRISRKPPEPIGAVPTQLQLTHPGPPYNRIRTEPSSSAYSPRQPEYPMPCSQKGMVDSDSLW